MPNTFTLIASSTVGAGGASNIDFTSIPSTYTDLCLKYSIRGVAAFQYSYAVYTFNNDTSTSTSSIWLIGDGSTAGSSGGSGASTFNRIMGAIPNGNATANTFSNGEFYIPNYANTSYNKTGSGDGVGESNTTAGFMLIAATLWPVTSAINRLTLSSFNAGGIPQHSSASLYGIVSS